jgi:hypothetical protein
MRPRLFIVSLFILALFSLAACEPSLPQPFQPESIPALTKPGVRAGLVVGPVDGAIDAKAFSEALADALVDEDFAATTTSLPPPSYHLTGRAVPAGSSVRLEWQVHDSGNHLVGGTAYALPADQLPGWRLGDAAVYRALAKKAAIEIGNLLADSVIGTSEEPFLQIPAVTGAPGDGNRTLQRSMAYVLDKRGIKVTENPKADEKPNLMLKGVMKIQAKGTVTHVELVWTLTKPDGKSLGTVAQVNDVPAGTLNGPWGDIAYAIADAAGGGIADLVAKTMPPVPSAARSMP